MSQLALETITITEILRLGPQGVEIVPESAAVYFWTIDYSRLKRLDPEQAVATLLEHSTRPLRNFEGRAVPYYSVSISDTPPPLGPDRQSKLTTMLRDQPALAALLLAYATSIQRPLYVGQAANLRTRFKTHIGIGMNFRSYLEEAGLRLRDCALSYVEIPIELIGGSTGEEDGEMDLEVADLLPPSLDILEALLQRTARPVLGRRVE